MKTLFLLKVNACILGVILTALPQRAKADFIDLLPYAQVETTQHLERWGHDIVCFPVVTDPALVHIVSTKTGGAKIPPYREKHGATAVDITIAATQEPIYLVLTSHEPVVWVLDIAPKANIVAVALIGHFTQQVYGLPDVIPVGSRATELFTFPRSQSECILPDGISENTRKHLEDMPFSTIDNEKTAKTLAKLLEEWGPIKYGSFQYEASGDPLRFLVPSD